MGRMTRLIFLLYFMQEMKGSNITTMRTKKSGMYTAIDLFIDEQVMVIEEGAEKVIVRYPAPKKGMRSFCLTLNRRQFETQFRKEE